MTAPGGDDSNAAVLVEALSRVTIALSRVQTAEDVLAVITGEVLQVIRADAAFVALRDEAQPGTLRVAAAAGYPPHVAASFPSFSEEAPLPLAEAVRSGEPVWLDSRAERAGRYPHLARDFTDTPFKAWASLPLEANDRVIGGLGASFRRERPLSTLERSIAVSLAQRCADHLVRVRAVQAEHAARVEAEVARERLQFLADASAIVTSSLDLGTTLDSIARLVVPRLADWCAIYLPRADGTLFPEAAHHEDARKLQTLYRLLHDYPVTVQSGAAPALAYREGRSSLIGEVTDEMIDSLPADGEYKRLMRELNLRSVMTVPMRGRAGIVGAIGIASTRREHLFGREDLALAEELARRAALAVENANLYAVLRDLNESLELRIRERTREAEAARGRAEVLAGLADTLQSSLTLEEATRSALAQLGPALGAFHMAVYALAAGEVRLAAEWGEMLPGMGEVFRERSLPLAATPTLRAVVEGRAGSYSAAYRRPEGAVPLPEVAGFALGIEPVAAADGSVRALLLAARDSSLQEWLPGERDLLRRAAATVGLALERADAASRLQEQYLTLERQRDELAARNREQEAFVYTVAHDLRAPLLSIDAMTALLAEAAASGEGEEVEYFAGRVRANTARMSQLLNDLLTLSRIGRVDRESELISLQAAVREAVVTLDGRARERGAHLAYAGDDARVLLPPSELQQVLTNLLSNALKWAGRDGQPPSVEVAWARADAMVRVVVDDNGPGIEPRYRERVWALFQRLDTSTEGTGVGLTIVQRVVERHGGRAWIEDSPLGGARFVVTLPAAG